MLQANFRKELPHSQLEIEFSVNNEILVLAGPSGAGKTTVLQCLAGLQNPDQGEIKLGGRVVYSSKDGVNIPPKLRRIGYVFQEYALFPHMTVKKNVMYGIPKGSAARRDFRLTVVKALEMLRIAHLADRYPHQISGGEKQRVAMARALMTEPELMLLDEPLSALDHKTRTLLQQELRELQAKWQIPFVLVTHDMREAEILGDKIVRIDKERKLRSLVLSSE